MQFRPLNQSPAPSHGTCGVWTKSTAGLSGETWDSHRINILKHLETWQNDQNDQNDTHKSPAQWRSGDRPHQGLRSSWTRSSRLRKRQPDACPKPPALRRLLRKKQELKHVWPGFVCRISHSFAPFLWLALPFCAYELFWRSFTFNSQWCWMCLILASIPRELAGHLTGETTFVVSFECADIGKQSEV